MRLRRCFGHHLFPSTRYHWSVTFDTYDGRIPQGTPLRSIIVPILSRILLGSPPHEVCLLALHTFRFSMQHASYACVPSSGTGCVLTQNADGLLSDAVGRNHSETCEIGRAHV